MNRQSEQHFLIRADASQEIGNGHLMRMMALSQSLLSRGANVTIASIECNANLCDRLCEEKIGYQALEVQEIGGEKDNDATLSLARSLACNWVILDGYSFGVGYQRRLRAAGFKVAVVDDHQYSEQWAADLIINQNLGSEKFAYTNEVEDATELKGPSYALLRREFLKYNMPRPRKPGRALRVLVTLGGVDSARVTTRILQALERVSGKSIEVHAIISREHPDLNAMHELVRSSAHHFQLIHDARDMHTHYAWADRVISAGGSTCYEWLLYGMPAAIIVVAENQRQSANTLSDMGWAYLIGDVETLEWEECEQKVRKWIEADATETTRSRRVDPFGANRVTAHLVQNLKIAIASEPSSWLDPYVSDLVELFKSSGHEVVKIADAGDAKDADLLFLLSYWKIVPPAILNRHSHTLVVHASDLPEGRGWSPITWQVLEGASNIPICLIEAEEAVDSGAIYYKDEIILEGDELLDEIHRLTAEATVRLCQRFVSEYPKISSRGRQQTGPGSIYPRRKPEDSELDPNKTIAEQFNLLRVVDNKAYPAFFKLKGSSYRLQIERP